jgi:hypothetical protein
MDKDAVLRCHCDNNSKTKTDEVALKVCVTMKNHVAWEERHGAEQQRRSRLEEDDQGCHTTASCKSALTTEDTVFRMKYLQMLLSCGIHLNKMNGVLRLYVESILDRSLDSIHNVKLMCLKDLMKVEKELQNEELGEKKTSIIVMSSPWPRALFLSRTTNHMCNSGLSILTSSVVLSMLQRSVAPFKKGCNISV